MVVKTGVVAVKGIVEVAMRTVKEVQAVIESVVVTKTTSRRVNDGDDSIPRSMM